jgi:L-cysteine S-thiosulfotransferase
MRRIRNTMLPAAFALALAAAPGQAQDTKAEIEKYQRMIADSSPVELYELQGEAAWKKKQGPKNVSLEACDLGQGPGVVKGAYAHLPRYFADTGRVMDLETRLLHCMMTLQGRSRDEATKRVFGNDDRPSEMEYLSAYVAGESRNVPMSPGDSHPKEQAAYELGRKLFFHRAGAWDFSCASCHGEEGKRIRMQDLPVLSTPQAARPVVATWPAYRVSNSQFKTMQWRINDCYRQMRMPEPNFASDATIAINMFLVTTGKGEPYRGPGTKR